PTSARTSERLGSIALTLQNPRAISREGCSASFARALAEPLRGRPLRGGVISRALGKSAARPAASGLRDTSPAFGRISREPGRPPSRASRDGEARSALWDARGAVRGGLGRRRLGLVVGQRVDRVGGLFWLGGSLLMLGRLFAVGGRGGRRSAAHDIGRTFAP